MRKARKKVFFIVADVPIFAHPELKLRCNLQKSVGFISKVPAPTRRFHGPSLRSSVRVRVAWPDSMFKVGRGEEIYGVGMSK